MELAVDLRVGGTYRLAMRRMGEARLVSAHGTFRLVESPRRLVYTWHWQGAFPDMPPTEVHVRFHPAAGGTDLELEQLALPLPLCTRQLCGWLHAGHRLADCLAAPDWAAPDWASPDWAAASRMPTALGA